MPTLNNRVVALEAVVPKDRLAILFIRWLPCSDGVPRVLTTSWDGTQFTQGTDEAESQFLARIRLAIEQSCPLGKAPVTLFLNEQEVAL